jgi:hypothetical protein
VFGELVLDDLDTSPDRDADATQSSALSLLERALSADWDPAAWSPQDLRDLDTALGDDVVHPWHPSLKRWQKLRRDVVCRIADVRTAEERTATTAGARALVLAPRDQEALAPLGYLLERLAAVDPGAAADLLVEASRTVHAMPDGSWKGRRAYRWRAGIIGVVRALSPSAWRTMMTELAAADPDILTQALTVSVAVREDRPEAFLTDLLAASTVAPSVRAEFRNARMRRQRVLGGTGRWDLALRHWRSARDGQPLARSAQRL